MTFSRHVADAHAPAGSRWRRHWAKLSLDDALANPRVLLAGITLSVMAIGAQRLLPERRLDLLAANNAIYSYLLENHEPQSAGSIQWINEGERRFRCHYTQPANWQSCGIGFSLVRNDPSQGMDLSRFDAIEIKLSVKGPTTMVRLAARNFDARFSKVDDYNSPRMQNINLRVQDLKQPLSIDLNELTVPEWWIAQMNLPREYNRASLENAVNLTIDIPGDLTNKEYELQLDGLALKGAWVSREATYLAILCIWLTGATFISLRRSYQLHQRTRRQQREIDTLMSRTRELHIAQDELRRIAIVDELTSVLNRRGIEQVLNDLEDASDGITIVLADIDHFKRINDRHGHAMGDQVLSRFAAVLATNVRGSDVVGRWGGEEFIVLCRGHQLAEATALAEKLRERVEQFEFDPRHSITVTASFGVAVALPGHAAEQAFKRADKALYRAKTNGRNRVEASSGSEPATTAY